MRQRYTSLILGALFGVVSALRAQPSPVVYGAEVLVLEQLESLRGKRVGLVANQSSRVFDRVHLLDTLRNTGIQVLRVFAPEHGFRGTLEGGVAVASGVLSSERAAGPPANAGAAASQTPEVQLIGLYGTNERPTAAQLADLDLVLFDIQDVGARFYTYLGTLTHVVAACAEAGIPLWVLDRPNPMGWAVDGPVLDTAADAKGKRLTGLTGLHPIPVQHGMTFGEYATLLCGERWASRKTCKLNVILCRGYRHDMAWEDTRREWLPPSPNLRSPQAARWYPYLCWFEGTGVSVGRGTDRAFEVTGLPKAAVERSGKLPRSILRDSLLLSAVTFKPLAIAGRAEKPLYENTTCLGYTLSGPERDPASLWYSALLLLDHYHKTWERVNKQAFFNPYFDVLVGQRGLRQRIARGDGLESIYNAWQPAVDNFRKLRSHYLLYP